MTEKIALEDISPPPEGAISTIPERGSPALRRALDEGRRALDSGRVAVLILNGGMATRFSGVVKGVDVDVFGKSFLFWKLMQVRKAAPAALIFIMNSTFTNEITIRHLEELGDHVAGVLSFNQPVCPRETLEGKPFLDSDGNPSMAGKGHGDMLESFLESGMFHEFDKGSCSTLMVSNVDNLGAVLDPVIVGMHLLGGNKVTAEVARMKPEHVGGVVVSFRGRVQVLEGFRWPDGMNLGDYRYFNTNTFYLERDVLSSPPSLDLHPVVKEACGRKVVQREKILCEVTHFVEARFLLVPDSGEESRFIPVKTPQELESSIGEIRAVLRRCGLL